MSSIDCPKSAHACVEPSATIMAQGTLTDDRQSRGYSLNRPVALYFDSGAAAIELILHSTPTGPSPLF
eukprot:6178765-Pleurochrysis_carterae.AAC.1